MPTQKSSPRGGKLEENNHDNEELSVIELSSGSDDENPSINNTPSDFSSDGMPESSDTEEVEELTNLIPQDLSVTKLSGDSDDENSSINNTASDFSPEGTPESSDTEELDTEPCSNKNNISVSDFNHEDEATLSASTTSQSKPNSNRSSLGYNPVESLGESTNIPTDFSTQAFRTQDTINIVSNQLSFYLMPFTMMNWWNTWIKRQTVMYKEHAKQYWQTYKSLFTSNSDWPEWEAALTELALQRDHSKLEIFLNSHPLFVSFILANNDLVFITKFISDRATYEDEKDTTRKRKDRESVNKIDTVAAHIKEQYFFYQMPTVSDQIAQKALTRWNALSVKPISAKSTSSQQEWCPPLVNPFTPKPDSTKADGTTNRISVQPLSNSLLRPPLFASTTFSQKVPDEPKLLRDYQKKIDRSVRVNVWNALQDKNDKLLHNTIKESPALRTFALENNAQLSDLAKIYEREKNQFSYIHDKRKRRNLLTQFITEFYCVEWGVQLMQHFPDPAQREVFQKELFDKTLFNLPAFTAAQETLLMQPDYIKDGEKRENLLAKFITEFPSDKWNIKLKEYFPHDNYRVAFENALLERSVLLQSSYFEDNKKLEDLLTKFITEFPSDKWNIKLKEYFPNDNYRDAFENALLEKCELLQSSYFEDEKKREDLLTKFIIEFPSDKWNIKLKEYFPHDNYRNAFENALLEKRVLLQSSYFQDKKKREDLLTKFISEFPSTEWKAQLSKYFPSSHHRQNFAKELAQKVSADKKTYNNAQKALKALALKEKAAPDVQKNQQASFFTTKTTLSDKDIHISETTAEGIFFALRLMIENTDGWVHLGGKEIVLDNGHIKKLPDHIFEIYNYCKDKTLTYKARLAKIQNIVSDATSQFSLKSFFLRTSVTKEADKFLNSRLKATLFPQPTPGQCSKEESHNSRIANLSITSSQPNNVSMSH